MAKTKEKKTTTKSSAVKTQEQPGLGGEATGIYAISAKDATLDDLLLSGLKEIYWAEKHLTKALPVMIDATAGADLQAALTEHLAITKTQVERLEQAFSNIGENIAAQKCDAMEGLTMSGEHIIDNTVSGTEVRDTGIILSGLKVENFEITSYKGLIQLATQLGKSDLATIFQQNLDEELEAATQLETLSQQGTVNA